MDEARAAAVETRGPRRPSVLIIDDDPEFHLEISSFLRDYNVLDAHNGVQGRQLLARHHVDVVLLDLNMPGTSGLELLREWKPDRTDIEIIIITSNAELAAAVDCVKAGAFDFVPKTFEAYETVPARIERALSHRRERWASEDARGAGWQREAFAQLERSRSANMRDLMKQLRTAAPTPLTVLLEGESGVGKELLARWLHLHSDRANQPFVPVNVAAIPPTLLESTLFGHERGAFTGADRQMIGKFELADGGTLFLDEIGEMDVAFQAKVLRALQEREIERVGGGVAVPVHIRVVAATNRDLEADVMSGRFRRDLWYRLNVVRVRVPPLRERLDDLPDLMATLAARHAAGMSFKPPTLSDDALEALRSYSWPGNVRELENLVMRLVAFRPGAEITLDDVPSEYCIDHLSRLAMMAAAQVDQPAESLYDLTVRHFERFLVRHIVERCGGNKTEAAKVLGISYGTVKNKTKE